jgi:ESF2/ABP1 family protein
MNGLAMTKHKLFYDDLWTIKYLPKFKWHHLTDQLGTSFTPKDIIYLGLFLAYERATKDQQLRTELSQAKKSVDFYLKQADKAKQNTFIEKKKQAKLERDDCSSSSTHTTSSKILEMSRPKRTFRQRKPIAKELVNEQM